MEETKTTFSPHESLEEAFAKTKQTLLAYTRLMKELRGGLRSELRRRLDAHIENNCFEGYKEFIIVVDGRGSDYYYRTHADCSEFATFHEFEAAVDMARDLSGERKD